MSSLAYDLRQLPYSREAEAGVIACCLLSPDSLAEVRPVLRSSAFADTAFRQLAEVIYAMDDRNQPINVLTIHDAFRAKGGAVDPNVAAAVREISDLGAFVPALPQFIGTVLECYQKRGYIDACRKGIDATFDNLPFDEIITAHETALAELTIPERDGEGYTAAELGMQTLEELQNSVTPAYVLTGKPYFDALLKPRRGHGIIIAGRPSQGKTARAIDISRNWLKQGIPGDFYTCEQAKEEITDRYVANMAGVPLTAISDRECNDVQLRLCAKAIEQFNEYPIRVYDDSGLTVAEIRHRALRRKRKEDLTWIVIDQLNRLEAGVRTDNENQRFSIIMRQLKNLARAADVILAVLVQLNRNNEKRDNKRPQLGDLRDSGNLEAEASIVAACFRQSYYDSQRTGEDEPDESEAEFDILKYQQRRTGIIRDVYDRNTQRFFRYDNRHEDPKPIPRCGASDPFHSDAEAPIERTGTLSLDALGDYAGCVSNGDARAGR